MSAPVNGEARLAKGQGIDLLVSAQSWLTRSFLESVAEEARLARRADEKRKGLTKGVIVGLYEADTAITARR